MDEQRVVPTIVAHEARAALRSPVWPKRPHAPKIRGNEHIPQSMGARTHASAGLAPHRDLEAKNTRAKPSFVPNVANENSQSKVAHCTTDR